MGTCFHVVIFKSRILQDKNLEHFEHEDGQIKLGLCFFWFFFRGNLPVGLKHSLNNAAIDKNPSSMFKSMMV